MSKIDKLPDNNEIQIMDKRNLAKYVLQLLDPNTDLSFTAKMDTNRFLAHAAIKLAQEILKED